MSDIKVNARDLIKGSLEPGEVFPDDEPITIPVGLPVYFGTEPPPFRVQVGEVTKVEGDMITITLETGSYTQERVGRFLEFLKTEGVSIEAV